MEKWQKERFLPQQNSATPITGERAHRHEKEGGEERKGRRLTSVAGKAFPTRNWTAQGRSSAAFFRRLPPFELRIFGGKERGGISSLNRIGGNLFPTPIGSRREEEEDSLRESSPLLSIFFFFVWAGWVITFFPSKRNFILEIFLA